MNVSKTNPRRATLTMSKRGNKYRDDRNVSSLKKFHKCADKPHSTGCKKKERDKRESEKKTHTNVRGKKESAKFKSIKQKYRKRGNKIGKWAVTAASKENIIKSINQDQKELIELAVDDAVLIRNWSKKVKQVIKAM
jgi:hypothetical protein